MIGCLMALLCCLLVSYKPLALRCKHKAATQANSSASASCDCQTVVLLCRCSSIKLTLVRARIRRVQPVHILASTASRDRANGCSLMRRALTTIALGARYASSLSTQQAEDPCAARQGRLGRVDEAALQSSKTRCQNLILRTPPRRMSSTGAATSGGRCHRACARFRRLNMAASTRRWTSCAPRKPTWSGATPKARSCSASLRPSPAIDWLGGAKLILNGGILAQALCGGARGRGRGDTLHVFFRSDGRHQPARAGAAPGGVFRRCARFVHPGGHYVPTGRPPSSAIATSSV